MATIPKIPKLSDIPEEQQIPIVADLLGIINLQQEMIQQFKDEIARLKGGKGKPVIKPSRLEKPSIKDGEKNKSGKRPGSDKRKKTENLEIHATEIIKPDFIPEGSRFKEYRDYVVQDIIIGTRNTRYRLECWETPEGKCVVGKLPEEISGSHYGPGAISFILYQYYQCHVTQPLILEGLREFGVDISAGQVNEIITNGKDEFHAEKNEILRAGLAASGYVNVDDTGARHGGKNGYCTHIGNEHFAWFESTESKSRINFLKLLSGGAVNYVINPDAVGYMSEEGLPKEHLGKLFGSMGRSLKSEEEWKLFLEGLGIGGQRHVRIAAEGALYGGLLENGFNRELVILSDGAGQFNVFLHALCWIHAERSIAKLVGFDEGRREALEKKRTEIWDFYAGLKEYKTSPDEEKKEKLEKRFDEIFTEKTCFEGLNQALKRTHKNKSELLLVLERPDIPLHNNLSENDIREYVKRRVISGPTRSVSGRRCRDTFTSLKKTCRKLGISFWEYIKDRVAGKKEIPFLPELIILRTQQSSP